MGYSLWLGAIKIIIIKIMHRLVMILHAPHSILETSNTHVPNLISDLQSDKNKGKKARTLDEGISLSLFFSFFVAGKRSIFACSLSICQVGGKK